MDDEEINRRHTALVHAVPATVRRRALRAALIVWDGELATVDTPLDLFGRLELLVKALDELGEHYDHGGDGEKHPDCAYCQEPPPIANA